MKKLVLFTLSLLFTFSLATAQTVILDFEDGGSSAAFQYFGSTLEGSQNNVIDNPDQSGINTSAKVADFQKPAGSQVWAGAFGIDPGTVDLTTDNQVCIKVWMEQAGNLALKLENSPTGSPDWISTIDVADAQTWVELCYNVDQPSIEAPFEPAAGGTYDGVVLFFDFGTSPDADRNYYFDDIITQMGTSMPVDVTFSVDMNSYGGSIGTVYVSGTFNEWSGDANPLSDDDNDGVWTGTVSGIDIGTHEYKFTIDNWMAQEEFTFSGPCTVTDPSGQFTNRLLLASSTETLPTVCFGSCYACGEGAIITVNLGAGGGDPANGFYIAGGGNFGNPGDFPMSDNGDGTYSIVLERNIGFESFYTFTNGACPDFSCKENIAGQDCANPDNFNDRFMGPLTADGLEINTCFGECTTDTNCGGAAPGDVTFQVDMNGYGDAFTTVYLSGSFNNWSGDANPMTDDDGDGVWETTIPLAAGNYEYKFQLDAWMVSEEFADGEPCTVTDPSGQFVNRAITVDGNATVCFIWNSCDMCGGGSGMAGNITFQVDMNGYAGDFTTVYVSGTFNEWSGDSNPMADDDGDGIWEATIAMPAGDQEFKYQLDAWTVPEEFVDGDPCTVTDPSGQFVNRLTFVDGDATICFLWNSCTACGSNNVFEVNVDNTIFSVQPTIVQNETLLIFGDRFNGEKEIKVINTIGQVVEAVRVLPNTPQYNLNVNDLDNGIYFINVQTEGKIQTQKIIVQK